MPVSCSLSQDDVCKIACKLKEMLRSEIDYTIKSTIDHYKGEICKLNSENEKLREDLDALEQYGRCELMRINGIPDGGQEETTANTTKLVTDLVKSIRFTFTSFSIYNWSGSVFKIFLLRHTEHRKYIVYDKGDC
jgi:hypothetical protein